ncbi:MAG: [acyl-carrier-protein] S-malonyltransferase [Planctomycetes bacterium]|nr:[acyl-carrier-protein] S-malonyltransferase [Planctomycetota bacterium]
MRAIVFPGQGAQHLGMGLSFHTASAAARDLFARASAVMGFDLAKVCFEGPDSELEKTDLCQPAIFVCSAAIVVALEECGELDRKDFACTAGLSLGEYTALWFAEAIGFEDCVAVVRERGRGMQAASEAAPSGMLALLGATEELARTVCDKRSEGEVLNPANFLCPGNIAISGAKAALERVTANARADGVRRAIPLKVAGAFHSALMAPGVPQLTRALDRVKLAAPRIPVFSNVTAAPHGDVATIAPTLLRQVTSPVLWERSMRALIANGATDFFEPGPGAVLTGLLGKIDGAVRCRNVQKIEDVRGSSGAAATEGAGG